MNPANEGIYETKKETVTLRSTGFYYMNERGDRIDLMQRRSERLANDCMFLKIYHNGFAAKELLILLKESIYRFPKVDGFRYVELSWERLSDPCTKSTGSDWQLLFICSFICFPELRDAIFPECNQLAWFLAYGYLVSRWTEFCFRGPVFNVEYVEDWCKDCLCLLAYPNPTALAAITHRDLLHHTLIIQELADFQAYKGLRAIPTFDEWNSLQGSYGWSLKKVLQTKRSFEEQHSWSFASNFYEIMAQRTENDGKETSQLEALHAYLAQVKKRYQSGTITLVEFLATHHHINPSKFVKD